MQPSTWTIAVATAGKLVALLYCFQLSRAIAGTGSLGFLTLFSPSTLSPSDDGISPAINVGSNGFRFGPDTVTSVYVSINGYISIGASVSTISPNIPGTSSVVSPYGDDIDTRTTGRVRFTQFTTTDSQISTVSSFIRSQTSAGSFFGARMMVAEWNSVPEYSRSLAITSTFQAVLITDGSDSYAVFIYQCGGMEWSGATIGWGYSGSLYEKHSLSGSNSASIGCEYSGTSSAVIYKIDRCTSSEFPCFNGECVHENSVCNGFDDCGDSSDEEQRCDSGGCDSSQFTCGNGWCVPEDFVCNGFDDCGDHSDEDQNCGSCAAYQFTCDNGVCESRDVVCDGFDDCGDNSDEEQDCNSENFVGLAVGVSVGLTFLLCCCGGSLCGCFFLCSRKRHPPQTHVVATTPATGPTVVSTTESNTPTAYPMQLPPSPYSPQPSPTVYPTQPPSPMAAYSQQPQMMYQDAQFSPGLAPPSYDTATSYPTVGLPQSSPVASYPAQQTLLYPPQQTAPYPPVLQSPHSDGYPSPSPYQSYPSSPSAL